MPSVKSQSSRPSRTLAAIYQSLGSKLNCDVTIVYSEIEKVGKTRISAKNMANQVVDGQIGAVTSSEVLDSIL